MASGSVVFSKCAKALSGTALLVAELVAPAVLDVAVEVLAESALRGRSQSSSPTECTARSWSARSIPPTTIRKPQKRKKLPHRLRPKTHWTGCKAWCSLLGSF